MSGGNATTSFLIALNADGGAPDWIMILPATSGVITTVDGRGPYRIDDAARLMSDSLQAAGGKLAIDENHSTDLAAPQGQPSPARGWVMELQARADGIYGRVEWTETGKQLLADRAYRGISPVIMFRKDGAITRVLRASLTNVPNLRGMAALHAEGANMEQLLAQLRAALGLKDDADQAAIVAKVKATCGGTAANAVLLPIAKATGLKDDADATTVLNAVTALVASTKTALLPIAKAAGLKDDADATAVLNAVTALATAAKGAEGVAALQTELTTVTTSLNALQKKLATDAATAFVDGAIKSGRVGVKPMRDHYIAMHATDPARVEKEINAMAILGPSGVLATPPVPDKDGKVGLNAEQLTVAKVLGIKPEDYSKTLATENTAAA
jgi:phage I-like protein